MIMIVTHQDIMEAPPIDKVILQFIEKRYDHFDADVVLYTNGEEIRYMKDRHGNKVGLIIAMPRIAGVISDALL